MKVGVVTLFGLFNYGNRLQNLAVTEILQRRGFSVETVFCEKISLGKICRYFLRTFLVLSKESQKNKSFREFNRKYIKVNHVISQSLQMPSYIDRKYDAFVVGSDQVWNPELRKRERDTFFLRFTSKNKRFCLSPSIGVNHIDDKYYEDFRDGFDGFNYLSCREEEGSKEITRITKRNCVTLIDPTLALGADYWRKIGEYEKLPKKKYVFSFFLGTPNNEIKESILKLAYNNNLIIIDMLDKSSPYYTNGPAYFISLIDKATIVFTDSFHAAAFSANLNTPFYTFERYQKGQSSMSSRILSLLRILDLEERFLGSSIVDYKVGCDFESANRKLNEQRKLFYQYLDVSLPKNN